MLRTYSACGVVLRRRNINESDRLLTIYSKSKGKITVIAKGIRKIRSKKAPHLELFNQIKMFVAKGRTFDIITEAVTLQSYSNIKKSLYQLAHAYLILEEVDKLCPEHAENPQIYAHLINILEILDSQENLNPDLLVYEFTHSLLWELGYLPKSRYLPEGSLNSFVMSIIEKRLNSLHLLTKISNIL